MTILNVYKNFADIYLSDLITPFLENMRIRNYAIKLINNHQLFYGLKYYMK